MNRSQAEEERAKRTQRRRKQLTPRSRDEQFDQAAEQIKGSECKFSFKKGRTAVPTPTPTPTSKEKGKPRQENEQALSQSLEFQCKPIPGRTLIQSFSSCVLMGLTLDKALLEENEHSDKNDQCHCLLRASTLECVIGKGNCVNHIYHRGSALSVYSKQKVYKTQIPKGLFFNFFILVV